MTSCHVYYCHCRDDAKGRCAERHPAVAWLVTASGKRIPGGAVCSEYAEKLFAEYQEKIRPELYDEFDWPWSLLPIAEEPGI